MQLKNTYRKEGILKNLKRNTIPKHVAFYDTETNNTPDKNGVIDFTFKIGVIIYVKFNKIGQVKHREIFICHKEMDVIQTFIDLSENENQLYVFAHNQGFDLRVINAFKLFDLLGYDSKPPIINNLVFIYGVRKGKQKIDFIDTANLGIRSVAQLGLDLGYEKIEVDFDTVSDEDLIEYCIRDTEILEKFVLSYLDFIRENKLGSFKVTLASQAMTAYRTKFMQDDIYIHNHHGGLTLEREAYYGGRTEAFKIGYIGQQDYYYLDVNSMYPYVMTNDYLPHEIIGYSEKKTIEDLKSIIKDYYCIADVTLDTDENIYPFRLSNKPSAYNYLKNPQELPYPKITTKKLIFPIGRFRTTIHNNELLRAIESDSIVKIHRLSWYTKNKPFDSYIDYFYEAKNKYGIEGNKTWRMISKLFLNSLYGKFGQLQPQRMIIGTDTEYQYNRIPHFDLERGLFAQRLYWNFIEYLEFKHGETAFSHPAISGAITANARLVLYEAMEIAGKDNFYYCDTDSIIVNRRGYENLKHMLDDNEIGKWSLEKRGRRLIIRGNKDYMLDATRVHKGISKTAIKKSFNLWEFLHFEGFITWWKNGAMGGAKGEYRTKSRKSEYSKGIVLDSGKVIPYYLQE